MHDADLCWMLISTALVLMMTPALGFFYGGMVRAKNALNTIMMSVVALGIVGLVWALLGYSLAFSGGGMLLGNFDFALLAGVDLQPKGTIPHVVFFAYQASFAIITGALVSGSIVERMRFRPYISFLILFTLVVYAPVAHWVWGGGWLSQLGALDFAGGTVVHIDAAAAALVIAVMLGPRKDYAYKAMLPHNVPFTLLGTGLLWFGWFGFNAGSALGANAQAGLAFVNTLLAPVATLCVWTALDSWRSGTVTAVGAATAIVVGLVAITPGAGYVSPRAALLIGAIAAAPSYFAILYRTRTRLDDSLDVLAAHGLGGATGALLTGVFAQKVYTGTTGGLLEGNARQLGIQAIGVVAAASFSAACTFVLVKLIALVSTLRVSDKDERFGLDSTQHGEEAYTRGDGALLIKKGDLPVPPRRAQPDEPPPTARSSRG